MTGLLPLPVETVSIFVLASLALGLAPGPDNIFVLTQSAMQGRKAGFLVTLGLCTGILVHTTAVALGMAAVFATSAVAFNIVKIVGAIYLLYLAWQAFRAPTGSADDTAGEPAGAISFYVRGVIMNITNPKVAIFFLAFLPQFADPSFGSMTIQMMFLGMVFIVTTAVVFGSLAWLSGIIGRVLRQSTRAQRNLNRIAGLVFVALSLRLVMASR